MAGGGPHVTLLPCGPTNGAGSGGTAEGAHALPPAARCDCGEAGGAGVTVGVLTGVEAGVVTGVAAGEAGLAAAAVAALAGPLAAPIAVPGWPTVGK